MKISQVVTLGLVLCATSSVSAQSALEGVRSEPAYFAQKTSIEGADLGRIARLYQWALESKNQGVVESALAHLTHIRIVAPGRDLGDVESTMMSLVRHADSYSVRTKAALALQVFAQPGAFRNLADRDFNSPDELFEAVAQRIEPAI